MGVLLCFAITCGLSILVYLFLEEPARRSLRRQQKAVVAAPGPTSPAGAAVV
jgi:peptidoglycan/LPS O-acetylase OafA/YrhL